MEEAGLFRTSKEEIIKEKDRLGHFDFILIKTLCMLNTHTHTHVKWRGKQVRQEKNPDTLSKVSYTLK